jgi:SHS2 domain-containing protein
MPYRFLPEVALADVAFEAESKSLSGLFESCARALTDVMVDRRTLSPRIVRTISLSSEDLDRLLYDLLTELIILKDVDSLLFKDFNVKVNEAACSLECTTKGETISRGRHLLRNDVKAVTMHLFGIRHRGKKWKATVVLDI